MSRQAKIDIAAAYEVIQSALDDLWWAVSRYAELREENPELCEERILPDWIEAMLADDSWPTLQGPTLRTLADKNYD